MLTSRSGKSGPKGLNGYENGKDSAAQISQADIEKLKRDAEAGDAEAQADLGVCYALGRGVKRDDREAVKWFRKAAEQGYAYAQSMLGRCYADGQGVKQDYREAVKWIRKAAEQGNASAQFNLGVHYADGQGVKQDYGEAVKWYRKAAEQRHAGAQYNLGVCYYMGQGVIEDYTEAYKWFLLAGMNGKDVSEIKNDLKKEMTVRQIAEAQQKAKGFAAGKDKEIKQKTNIPRE